MDGQPHRGHRSRMKERFLRQGLEGFAPHEVLELLLFYAVPRKDTNVLAHTLLGRFGSLRGVFSASREELMLVEGVGEHTASLLEMILPLHTRLRLEEQPSQMEMCTPLQIAAYLGPLFQDRKGECFYLLCLDAAQRLLQSECVAEGTATETRVDPQRLVATALRSGCAAVVFAHNHPGGKTEPSAEDVQFTRRMISVLDGIGIPVLDHMIFSGEDFFSFNGQGLIQDIRSSLGTRI